MRFFRKKYTIDELYKHYSSDLYRTIYQIPFDKWVEISNGHFEAVKICEYSILDGILSHAVNILINEKRLIFGLSKEEISHYKLRADIEINRWKYSITGKSHYNVRANASSLKLQQNGESNAVLGDYARAIFKHTRKTYDLSKITTFEALTIINSIKSDIEKTKRNGNS